MQKIGIVTSSQDLAWVSCKSISANLLESYRLALNNEFQLFSIRNNDSKYAIWRSASEIADFRPTQLIFIDHAPCPANLIRALREIAPDYQPHLTIHIYGDFILQAKDWVAAEPLLNNLSIHWICASDKQANLLKKFVSEKTSRIEVCPFPVSRKEYYCDENIRKDTRKEFAILENDTVFLYTGRLSLQKNILSLIRTFDFYQKNINPTSILLMAGPIDDIGIPYLGKRSPPGLMAFDIQLLMNTLFSSDRRNRIRYLGNLNSKKLNSFYNAADLFISLSTHNDEDYGMAPAEALLAGCPCILTDWGGYSGFKDTLSDYLSYVPTQISAGNTFFNQKDTVSAILKSNLGGSIESRKQIAELALKRHSVESCSEKINHLINYNSTDKFDSFSSLFHNVEIVFSVNPESPFSKGQTYSNLYKDVYSAYQG